jgi:hypothetical protein
MTRTNDLLVAVPVGDVLDVAEAGDVDLTPDEAERITSRIRQWANSFPTEDVVRAFRGRIWVALAYDSWSEWCECELGGLKLPVPQRREIVSELAGAGMSNRAIADTISVDRQTVANDLKAGGENSPPDRMVIGQDGKSYPQPKPPAPEPEPEIVDAEIVDPPEPAKPRRRALTDTARDLSIDLDKMSKRLRVFVSDDRIAKNKNEVAPRLRHHLAEVIKVCQDLDNQLS